MKLLQVLPFVLVAACVSPEPEEPAAQDDFSKDDFVSVQSRASYRKSLDQLRAIVPAGTFHGFTRDEGEPCTVVVEHWDSESRGPGIGVTTWRKNDAPEWGAVGEPSFSFAINGWNEPIRVTRLSIDTISAAVKRGPLFDSTRQKLTARGKQFADVPYVKVWSAQGLDLFGDSLVCASLNM